MRDRGENLKRAIKAYEEALTICTIENYPVHYATTQNNLGFAYGTFSEVCDKEENVKKAIRAFEAALKIRTIEKYLVDYATTQHNLGIAYSTLAENRNRS